jgi:hypothetical protein
MKKFFSLLITIIIFLSIQSKSNVFANSIKPDTEYVFTTVTAESSSEQSKRYDSEWFEWYYASPSEKWYDPEWFRWYYWLPSEIQYNVNLPEFSDWKIQTSGWFRWYTDLDPEFRSRVKRLDYFDWNEQTYKWLEWFSSQEPEFQRKYNLREARKWYDHYNSTPFDFEVDIAMYDYPYDISFEILRVVYERTLNDLDLLRHTGFFDFEWHSWFNSLPIEEQRKVYYRPKHFAPGQRITNVIPYVYDEAYITIYKEVSPITPPIGLTPEGASIYLFDDSIDRSQKYVPTTLDKIYEIAMYIEDNPVKYASEPYLVTFDLSDSIVSPDDFSHLFGILHHGDDTKEYISGTYDQDIKTFTFYIDKPGDYSVSVVKNITQLKLTVDSTSYTVNNMSKTFESAPIVVDGRTMVPVRPIAEFFDAQVQWDEVTKTATIISDEKTLAIIIGQLDPGMDVPAQIINNSTMVPLRYISENFGANVIYKEETKSITIEVTTE